MSLINKIDKLTQAERKLAGLCQICGGPKDRFALFIGDYCKYKRTLKWRDTPNECLDKIMRSLTGKHIRAEYLKEESEYGSS